MLASCLYGNLPLAEVLPEVRKTGATTIDLWPKVHGTQREELDALGPERFAELLQQHGVRLGGSSRFDLGGARIGPEIDLVSKCGGRMIVVGGNGNYRLTGAALKAEVRAFVEKVKPNAARAVGQGVTIAIENHEKTIIETPDSIRWLADFLEPGMGIALAPYHLPQDAEMMAGLIRELGPRLALFYAWQHGQGCDRPMPKADEMQQLPGRGTLPFRPLLGALRAINFTGPTEIFMHTTPRGAPILPTAAEVSAEINRARTHLGTLLT